MDDIRTPSVGIKCECPADTRRLPGTLVWVKVKSDMLNFLRRDQRKLPLSLLTAWTLWSATLPWIIPAFFALLMAGGVAAMGGSFTDALFDFASETGGDLLRLNGQLWVTAFFMVVVCYGVGRQLVGLTNRRSLCAPLAALAARLGRLARFLPEIFASRSSAPDALPVVKVLAGFSPDSDRLAPPVALLTGSAPLLE